MRNRLVVTFIIVIIILFSSALIVSADQPGGTVYHKFLGDGECTTHTFTHFPPEGQGWQLGDCPEPTDMPPENTPIPTDIIPPTDTTPEFTPTDTPPEITPTNEPPNETEVVPTDVVPEFTRVPFLTPHKGATTWIKECEWQVSDNFGTGIFRDVLGGWNYGPVVNVVPVGNHGKVTIILSDVSPYLYRPIDVIVNGNWQLRFDFEVKPDSDKVNHVICKRL